MGCEEATIRKGKWEGAARTPPMAWPWRRRRDDEQGEQETHLVGRGRRHLLQFFSSDDLVLLMKGTVEFIGRGCWFVMGLKIRDKNKPCKMRVFLDQIFAYNELIIISHLKYA